MEQQSEDNYDYIPGNLDLPAFIELSSVDSTNNYALHLLRNPPLPKRQESGWHGTGIFAHEQYAGKGQRGKIWQSSKDGNIHLSVILKPEMYSIQEQFILVAAISLAVKTFFEKYARQEIFIKWPNDIYFKDRKAGGILIESIISGSQWKWVVAGIGFNVNQVKFDPSIDNKAVSLTEITGKRFNCVALARELRDCVVSQTKNVVTEKIMNAYNASLYKRNTLATFNNGGEIFKAIVKKVLPNGKLMLLAEQELLFDFGELEWV